MSADRRALFFLAAAGLCFLLVPISGEYVWLSVVVGVVYVVLAVASWLDGRSD